MNTRGSTLLSLGISLALIAAGIWFLYNHHAGMGFGNTTYWTMPHHMIAGGYGMGIVMILFWVAVVAAIILLVSGALSGRSDSNRGNYERHDRSLEILKERYARGEIDKDQFKSMRHELN